MVQVISLVTMVDESLAVVEFDGISLPKVQHIVVHKMSERDKIVPDVGHVKNIVECKGVGSVAVIEMNMHAFAP